MSGQAGQAKKPAGMGPLVPLQALAHLHGAPMVTLQDGGSCSVATASTQGLM